MDRIRVHRHVLHVHAHATHVLIAQHALAGRPLPRRNEGVLHLRHVLHTLRHVHDHVRAAVVGAVAPDLASLRHIPLEGVGEVARAVLGIRIRASGTLLDRQGQLLRQRGAAAEQTVVLVCRLGQALHVGQLGHGLAEGHDGLGDLQGSAVHEVVLEILQADLQVQLTRAGHDVLTGLLNGAHDERIGLGEALQALHELGQIGRILRLNSHTHDGGHGVLHIAEGVGGLTIVGDGGGFDDVLVYANKTHDVTARHVLDGLLVATHHQHGALHRLVLVQVLLLAVDVVVTHDANLLAAAHRTGEDTAERKEAPAIGGRHHLADVQHQGGLGIAVLDTHEVLVRLHSLAGVQHIRTVLLRPLGGREMRHDHLQQRLRGRQELHHDGLEQLLRHLVALLGREGNVQRLEHLLHLLLLLVHDGVEDLVHGVQAELAEGAANAVAIGVGLLLDPLLVLRIEEVVTPQALAHLHLIHAELRRVHVREAGQREGPGLETRADRHGALIRGHLQVTHAGVVVRRNHDVHVLQRLDEALVRLLGVQLELEDSAVDLVDEDDGADALRQRLAQHRLRLHAHALHTVHHHQRTVRHTEGGSHLGAEVNVPGGVDQVDQKPALVVIQLLDHLLGHVVVQGNGGRLDRDTAGNLIRARIHQALVTRLLHLNNTGGADKRVRQGGLAVIDVGNDGHVTDLFRVVHQTAELINGEVNHLGESKKKALLTVWFVRRARKKEKRRRETECDGSALKHQEVN
ncbi:elongation factor 2 [Strigomonas culicis]|uniref:Elongation factor 2 n=1 Tax=Strigomonas culicis TaxID=28005 RepID=S9UJ90_9TRYP|nr:elongation factor 2 [Strigomonas culicis]|eukprot:EPY30887.1 elongation factor 2 [Strigomonas culicis]